MDIPNVKTLKKLADACRKAGIKEFKGYGFEFTLSDEAPVSNYKKAKQKAEQPAADASEFQTDSISDEALLFWSSPQEDLTKADQ